jgi:hypothetical protein
VVDHRCETPECQTEFLVGQIKALFEGLEVTELEWATPEGKAAYAEYGLRFLPACVFDESIEADSAAVERVRRYLRPTARPGSQWLDVGAMHDPNAEICQNAIDDTGDGLVDCEDPTCAEHLACRPVVPGSLQVFVMSHCPFAVKALDALREVLAAFGSDIEFDIHYIASAEGDGFNSLHGQGEVEEDIRELCAKHLRPDDRSFLDYVWCRNRELDDPDWRACAIEGGIDADALDACSTGEEGRRLLREDIEVARTMGVTSSPTWLVDNTRLVRGADARTIQAAICGSNPTFAGCDTPLSGPPPGAVPAGCAR